MKTALLTLLFLLPFTFTTKLPSSSFASAEPVLDTQGQPVKPRAQYYILPDISDPMGGGLVPGYTKNLTCTFKVVQDISLISKGLPVKLSPLHKNRTSVTTDTLLKISFAHKIKCSESSKWVLVKDTAKGWSVGIGGAKDHPGKKTLRGSFKIQKFDSDYKIVFRPKFGICGDIGTLYDDKNGYRRLVLGTVDYYPFKVALLKA